MEQNAKIAQKNQKEYYDQRAKKTKLDPGDKVLLLLSSSTKKFLAQWQGPYSVTRRVGKVNYEIEMPDNGGRKQVFHVNYLRKFHERETEIRNAAIEKVEDIEHSAATLWRAADNRSEGDYRGGTEAISKSDQEKSRENP